MNLQDFMFPICERPVAINNGQNDITDWDNVSTFLSSDLLNQLINDKKRRALI